jgi:hypothetical protein
MIDINWIRTDIYIPNLLSNDGIFAYRIIVAEIVISVQAYLQKYIGLEIKALVWDRHKNVTGLNPFKCTNVVVL